LAWRATGNPDFDGDGTVATGTLTSLVSVGADEDGTFSVSTDTSGLPQNLTSKGDPIVYNVTGDTLTGLVDIGPAGLDAGDRVVFTLKVEADGNYTFTLLDQLDHSDGDDPDSELLAIDSSSIVQFTDFDEDVITLSGGFLAC
jgi:T1SS-143 domain-containing protein